MSTLAILQYIAYFMVLVGTVGAIGLYVHMLLRRKR